MTDSAAVDATRLSADRRPEPSLHGRIVRHGALLLALLSVIAMWIGTSSAFVTDESLMVIQLNQLETAHRWTVDHPMPEIDPEGGAFAFRGALETRDGYILYPTHPLLVLLYLGAHRSFGLVGLVGISILGAVGAAVGAALLAERIRAGSALVAFWLTGVGSPIFFDGFMIQAHTLAAALTTIAVLLALRAADTSGVVSWATGAAAIACTLVVALLRTEGVLLAGALGVATLAKLLSHRRLVHVGVGVGCVGAGLAAHLIDEAWIRAIAGEGSGSVSALAGSETASLVARITSLLGTRLGSLSYTMLMPGYRGITIPELMTFVGASLVIAGAVVVRRHPHDRGSVILTAVGALTLLVRSVLLWGPVPGLLVAFCAGVAGLVLLDRAMVREPTVASLMLVVAAFVPAVALTQYSVGGHTEWGGRYFALVVPLLAAVSAAALSRSLSKWDRQTGKVFRLSLAASALGLAVLGTSTIRSAHERNRARTDSVLTAASSLAHDDGPPVVVTEDEQLARLLRGRASEVRLLTLYPAMLEKYLSRLARANVEEVLVVSVDPRATISHIPQSYALVGEVAPYRLQYRDAGGLLRLRLAGSDAATNMRS